jgi:hypothetical protein
MYRFYNKFALSPFADRHQQGLFLLPHVLNCEAVMKRASCPFFICIADFSPNAWAGLNAVSRIAVSAQVNVGGQCRLM